MRIICYIKIAVRKLIKHFNPKSKLKDIQIPDIYNDVKLQLYSLSQPPPSKCSGLKRKYEIAKQERLFDAIKNFKNEESLSKSDLKKIDGLVNRRIKEIAKKIRFKFNKDDEKQFFEFEENINYDIEIIEKKAELVDYVQKTFEVMGIIN